MTRFGFSMTTIALVLMSLMLYWFAGRGPEAVMVTLEPGPAQPRVSPEEAGLDPQAIENAVAYAAARNTRALLVGHGGHIVFEKYWQGATADTRVDPGFSPVLAALAVGTALNDRLILNLDAPISGYLEKSAAAADRGPDGALTLRELMTQERPELSLAASADAVALVLEQVTSQSYATLISERLWKPMGAGSIEFRAGDGPWRHEGVNAGCCVSARIGDWMRIGELLAHDGVFLANQFTPPRYVTLMMKPAHRDSPRGFFTRVDGTFAARDVAWLEGHDRQRLWIVPSLRLAILRIGGEPPAGAGWDEAMIPDTIIRGMRGWQPAPVGEGIDPRKFAPH